MALLTIHGVQTHSIRRSGNPEAKRTRQHEDGIATTSQKWSSREYLDIARTYIQGPGLKTAAASPAHNIEFARGGIQENPVDTSGFRIRAHGAANLPRDPSSSAFATLNPKRRVPGPAKAPKAQPVVPQEGAPCGASGATAPLPPCRAAPQPQCAHPIDHSAPAAD